MGLESRTLLFRNSFQYLKNCRVDKREGKVTKQTGGHSLQTLWLLNNYYFSGGYIVTVKACKDILQLVIKLSLCYRMHMGRRRRRRAVDAKVWPTCYY